MEHKNIYNSRKLNQEFGQYAVNLVNFVGGTPHCKETDIFDKNMAYAMKEAGVLTSHSCEFGEADTWCVNTKHLYQNGYLNTYGRGLVDMGTKKQEDYKNLPYAEYLKTWANAVMPDHISVLW